MEQPTVFYAIAVSLAVLGQGGGTNATLAWVYVALRVAHSLIQAIVNKIEVRFGVFVLSSLVLIGLRPSRLRRAGFSMKFTPRAERRPRRPVTLSSFGLFTTTR
jgi:hypothetical protein